MQLDNVIKDVLSIKTKKISLPSTCIYFSNKITDISMLFSLKNLRVEFVS